jgi:hypothetical protein
MKLVFAKCTFVSLVLLVICLFYGLECVDGYARDFTYLISNGRLLYILPIVCAGIEFIVVRTVCCRQFLSPYGSTERVKLSSQITILALAFALPFVPLASVCLLKAALLDSIDLPSRSLSAEQLPWLTTASERKLGFKVVCYWRPQMLHVVFRSADDRTKAVRETMTAELSNQNGK